MNTIPFETHTLACGLRVIYEPSDSPVLYCGIVVRAGTRHEEPADEGMAHFIEHMAFKGTERRSVWHITNGLERVGGELNAFTTKQETVYHATVLKDDFKRAADLLTDIVFHSVYRQDDITREVEVICDEIDSYEDTPSERIFDEY
ncbi:MAG: M16 family metallopeptidase, partial [Alloprevotella sp.]